MLEVSEAEAASLAVQAAGVDAGAVTRVMEVFSECEMRLRDAASKKILIEVALLKAMEARRALSLDSVLQQLQSLRDGTGATPTLAPQSAPPKAPQAPAARAVEPAAPVAMKESAPAGANGGGHEDLRGLWVQLVESVGRASPFMRTYLLEAHPVSFKNLVFIIGFDAEFEEHISLVDNARNHTLLQTKLSELGHARSQIKFIKAERPAEWAAQSVESASAATASAPSGTQPAATAAAPAKASAGGKDDFKNDPLIKKALEIFRGQIVEVRS